MTLAALMLLAPTTRAETAKWVIKPEYKKIVRYSNDLFKCQKDNGKYQLVDCSGNVIVQEADSITDYAGGYALALNQSGGKYQILGFVSEKTPHTYQQLKGEYYTGRFSFFSEDCVSVADNSGKQGYLNSAGTVVIPCKYFETRPFKYGYASVKKTDGYVLYVNKNDTPPRINIENKPTYATNFNDEGQAMVACNGRTDKLFYIMDRNFSVGKPHKIDSDNKSEIRKFESSHTRTYDYAFSNDGSGLDWKPQGNVIPATDHPLAGVVPDQFSDSRDFADGYAIAAVNGRYGVLQLLQGQFQCFWPDTRTVKVYPGQKCDNLHFSLQIPNTVSNTKLNFDCGDGMTEKNSSEFNFTPVIQPGATKVKLNAKVTSDNLVLWEESKEMDLAFIHIDVAKPATTSVYANENDEQTVKTTITNNSDVEVAVNATLRVGGSNKSFNGTLGPHKSTELKVTLKVTDEMNGKTQNASVSVKVDGGHEVSGSSSTVKLQTI